MRKIILMLLILFFLVSCVKYNYNYSYEEIKRLDLKYGGDFKNEMLNETMVSFDNISLMRNDLLTFREKLLKKGNESRSAILLVDARLNMLESEKFWYLGKNLGSEGIVSDGFKCSEISSLLLGIRYFNESLMYTRNAFEAMDTLLILYPDSVETFGINENKIRFYYSPLNYLGAVVELNGKVLEQYCGYKSK